MIRKDREITDVSEICCIVKRAAFLHLGLMDGDYPYVVPLHYGFVYSATEDAFTFYMHGAKRGHKLDLIRACAHAFVEIDTDAALLSGGDDPCEYSSFYASFMGRGEVAVVEDTTEKIYAMQLLMQHLTGRHFDFTEEMAASAAIIRVTVRSYTAKAYKNPDG